MKAINLSDKQYEHLVKLVFIGEWVLNAQKLDQPLEEEAGLANFIFSKCENFGLSKWFMKCESFKWDEGEWEMIQEKAQDITSLVDEYSKNDLWSHLIMDLALRDMKEKVLSNKDVQFEKSVLTTMLDDIGNFYDKEFKENGLDNLRIVKPNKASEN